MSNLGSMLEVKAIYSNINVQQTKHNASNAKDAALKKENPLPLSWIHTQHSRIVSDVVWVW